MSAQRRPSGTDGSDFSYRMVVDSRYKNVTKFKRRLAVLFIIQTILQSVVILSSLPINLECRAENYDVISSFMWLISIAIGEYGRRRSRENFLCIFLVVAIMAGSFAMAGSSKNRYASQVMKGLISWNSSLVDLTKFVTLILGNATTAFVLRTAQSLVDNMSPPKSKVA